MSEADSPNDQPDSASIEPSEQPYAVHDAADTVKPTDEEGWETIDFPGAMSIDALPHSQSLPPMQLPLYSETIKPGVIHYSSAALDPATAHLMANPTESLDVATQLQQLQKENAALRDRLTQAELDLAQHQIEWQLETACAQAETTTGEVAEPITDRLHQLLQELERSQQTAQRQQILVETLTEQLESSQERIAQLERDCALTQQRHNEQVQQVLQAESACRDLRLRLHRQQQQTLQFKAALEKCLEMPTVYSQRTFTEATLDDSTTPYPLSALLPKNQPVKPWSHPVEAAQTGDDQPALPKPLFSLLNHDASEQSNVDLWQESDALIVDLPFGEENQRHPIADSTESSALVDSEDPQFVAHLMQLMFPETAEGQPLPGTEALAADVSQAESIFDLSPFSGAEPPLRVLPSVDGIKQADVSPEPLLDEQPTLPSENTAIVPVVLPNVPSAELLWHDLAAFIDPSSTTPNTDMAPAIEGDGTPVALTQAPSGRGAIPPLSAGLHPALPPTSAPVSTSTPVTAPSEQSAPLNTWTWRDRVSSPNKAPLVSMAEHVSADEIGSDGTDTEESDTGNIVIERMASHPSKLLSLSTLNRRSEVKETVSVSSQTKPASASFATAAPSPIVYPLRSSKKLASLAAVDLPTFPKP